MSVAARAEPVHPHAGVGWRFPVQWQDDGSAVTSQDEQHVAEAIRLILRTAQGARAMRPEFGTEVDRYVFAPRTDEACFRLAADVRRALLLFEPRTIVERVEAVPAGDDENRIDVLIEFTLDRHRRPSSLVLPYYRNGAEEPA
jgi:phage baseplate assembly protein W